MSDNDFHSSVAYHSSWTIAVLGLSGLNEGGMKEEMNSWLVDVRERGRRDVLRHSSKSSQKIYDQNWLF